LTTTRVSHLSDARQVATSLNIARRKTDPLDLSSDQLTLLVDRQISVTGNIDAAGTVRATTGITPTTGQGVEVYHNGLTEASGIGTILCYDRAGAVYQELDINALTIKLQVSGTTIATIDSASVNLASGKVYKINSTQVVGPRSTGWTADTGTAEKGAHATYTAGSTLTFTDPPTAAEMSALATRIADIETAVQNFSRGQKAIKDAITTHGLIGT
jgi:hypothetical protein